MARKSEGRSSHPRRPFTVIVYELDRFDFDRLGTSDIAQSSCFMVQVTPGKRSLFYAKEQEENRSSLSS